MAPTCSTRLRGRLWVAERLGFEPPRSYAHVPLVLGPEGDRLAKRDCAVTLADRIGLGEDPIAVRSRLAASIGLCEPGEQPPSASCSIASIRSPMHGPPPRRWPPRGEWAQALAANADTPLMEMRTERVVLETARHRVVGDISLPSEGYRSRLSDYLNRSDVAFVSLSNAEVTALDDGDTHPQAFVAVACAQIEIAHPAE